MKVAAFGKRTTCARVGLWKSSKFGLALLTLLLTGVLSAGALAEVGPLGSLTSSSTSSDSTEGSADSASTSTETTSGSSSATAARDAYIVTFVSGVSDADARELLAASDANVASHIAPLRMYSVTLPPGQQDILASDARVARVEADGSRAAAGAPNDPQYADQWALPRIGWDHVYGTVNPTGSATVAVLDTGVNASHPELDGQLVEGASFVEGAEPTVDPNGHGTSMAGLVAANTNNDAGIAGVGFAGVKVMPVTVLDADGTGQDSDVIEGVVHAADHGADVILMSFSNPGYSASLQAAIDYAWAQGAVLVAAAGNGGSSEPQFPAGDRSVIGVAATDLSDSLSTTSNYGQAAFLAAPGEGVLTLDGSVMTGTSASAAIVAGAAALLKATSVGASNGVIVSRLARNADPAGTTEQTGNGRLNLERAILDTSSDSIQPAGSAPVGDGGPFVGPYVIAANGDGTMTVSPTSVTGGSTNTHAFSFKTSGNFLTGSQVSVLVPAGWTAPQNTSAGSPGFVSVTSTGGNACPSVPTIASTAGSTILLNINCQDKDQFDLTYANASAPATSATPANNTYVFTTKTKQGSGGTLTNISGQPTVSVSGPGSQLAFTVQPSASTAAGAPFSTQPRVTVRDVAGNTMTGDNSTQVTLAITSGTGTAGATLACTSNTVTVSNGVATFAGCDIDKVGTGYTLTATSSPPMTNATSNAFNITAGAAAKLAFTTSPSNTFINTAFATQPVVTVQDAFGNTVTGSSASITLAITAGTPTSGGPGTLTCTPNPKAAASGIATFAGCQISTAGVGYRLRASSGSLTVADSAAFTIDVPPPTKLAVTSVNGGANVASGSPFSVIVQAQESGGAASNVTADTDVSLSVDIGTGTLGGTLTGTIAAGSSSVTISGITYTNSAGESGVKLAATRTSGDSLSAGVSAAFTVVGEASKLGFSTSPSNSTGGISFATQPVVRVQDSIGNTVTGDSSAVTLSIAPGTPTSGGPGTLSGTTTVNALAGVATFSGLSINTAGTGYKLRAVSAALTSADSNAFNITVGAAAKLAFTTSPSDGVTNTAFATQPVVAVQDAGGNTVTTSSASITLSITPGTPTSGGPGTLTCTTNPRNAVNGVDTFAGCRINTAGVAYRLRATASGLTLADSAAFTVSLPPPTKLAVTSVNGGTNVPSGTGFSVVVQAQDAGGTARNVVAATGVELSIDAGSGTLGGTISGTIAAGSNSVTIPDVTYTKPAGESGVRLAATRTSGDSLTAGVSAGFTVVGVANKIAVTGLTSNLASGSTRVLTATIQDSNGSTITGGPDSSLSVTFSQSAGAGSVTGLGSSSSANGVATKTLTGELAGSVSISASATASSGSISSASPHTFSVVAGAATKLVITSVDGVSGPIVGVGFPVVVQAQDASGNPSSVTGSNLAFSLTRTSGTGTLGGTTNGTITVGQNNVTVTGVTYSKAETGVKITATRTSGPSPIAAGESAAFTVNNPDPTTTSISPASKVEGDASFTLTVSGANFVSGSVVRFDGSDRTTTFVSSTQLNAAIPASDLTTAGDHAITVFNSTPGGGLSNPQTFTLKRGTGTSVSCSPASATVGGATTCTATVSDTASGSPTNPTGSVSWTATSGAFSSASCALADVPASSSQSRCSVNFFAPSTVQTATITGTYGADAAHGGSNGNTSVSVVSCSFNLICIDGNMADWTALTTSPSYGDNSMDAGGGSGDITAIRITSGDGNLYVRWNETLTSNRSMIASDGFSITVDANRDGTPDARGWVMFNSSGVATVLIERPFGTFIVAGIAQQSCNFNACSNGGSASVEASFPLSAFNATGAIIGLQTETRASGSTSSAIKDCVPGGIACNGYFNLDTETGIVTVMAGHVTTTTLNCPDSTRTVNQATSNCTVTVHDTGFDSNNAAVTVVHPTGTVNFLVSGGDGTFAPAACTLAAAPAAADSTCTFTYTPTTIGSGTHTLTASYAGDTAPVQFASSTGTDTLTVIPVNSAPTATAQSVITDEDTAKTIALTGTDPNGDALTFRVTSLPASGKLYDGTGTGGHLITASEATTGYAVSDAAGKVTYDPNANHNGSDGFTFKASDGSLSSANATVSITVNAINDAPVNTVPGAQATSEDTPLTFSALGANGIATSDVDAGTNAVRASLSVSNGTLTVSGTTGLTFSTGDGTSDTSMVFSGTLSALNTALDGLAYDPASNYNGSDTLTVTTNDQGNTGSGGAKSDTDSVAITVTAVNDAPVCLDRSLTTAEDTPGDVAPSCSDVDGDALTYAIVAQPSHGAASVVSGQLHYVPAANYNGSDSFTYEANDGTVDSNAATVAVTVTAVNDAPVNSVPGAQSVGEDGTLVFSSANSNLISTSDVDAGSGAVSIALGVTNGTLTLSQVTGLTFTTGDGTADAAMLFTGTLANANAALAGMSFSPTANFNGSSTLALTTNDQGNTGAGGAKSDTDSVAITVTAVNDAPVCLDRSLTTAEDTPGDVAPSCSDVDGDALTYAIVAQPSHGAASVVSGQLHYVPAANYNGSDSFTYEANDGTVDSNTATVAVTVTAVNDAPTATNDAYSVDEDTLLSPAAPGALGNDTDIDSASLTAVLVAGPSHAAPLGFTLNADGSFSYTPAANFNGMDTFTYKANDGSLDSNVATVTITVDAVNDAPVAVADSATTNEDTYVDIVVSANDTDVDNPNSALTVAAGSITAVHGGTAVLRPDSRTVRFTPAANANNGNTPGGFGFSYKAFDGSLSSVSAAVVTVSVTAVNDAPVAAGDSYTFDEDTTFTLPAPGVLANDSDVDADTLTAVLDSDVSHGTLALNANGSFSYIPNANYNGSDSFTYHVRDGALDSNTVTVALTIAPVNDKPVATDGTASVNEDASTSVDLGGLVADVETADGNLTYSIVSGPSHGSLTGSGTSRTYAPAANYNGPDSFTYSVTDRGDPDQCGVASASCAAAKTSDTKTVSITVNPVNDRPSASDGSKTIDEDSGPTTLDLSALVSDVETDDADLSYSITSPTVAQGTLTGSGGSRTFTPAANFNGTVALSFSVTDRGDPDGCSAAPCAAAQTSETKTYTITVNPLNDKPVAADGSASMAEDAAAIGVDLTSLVSDVETSVGNLTYTIVTGPAPAAGMLTASAPNGHFSFDSADDFNGVATFTYSVTDRGDPDGCSSAPCAAAKTSETKMVSITVNPFNDTPSAEDGTASVDEDGSTSIDLRLLVADVETSDANLAYAIVSGPGHGTLSATATNGVRSYAPVGNYNGGDSFTYKVTDRGDPDNCSVVSAGCDGPETSAIKTVSITVNPVNDTPSASDGSKTIAEDAPATAIDLTALVDDVETSDANLTYAIVSGPSHGTLVAGSGAGSFDYDSASNYNGSDSFTYKVTDRGDPDGCSSAPCAAAKTSATKTVSITVTPVNDKPSAAASPTSVSMAEDGAAESVLVSGSDVETADGALTFTITAAPAHGSLKNGMTVLATGGTFTGSPKTLTYAPAGNYNGGDSFSFKVRDTGDGSSAALDSDVVSIPITVAPVNDTPNASVGSGSVNEDETSTVDLRPLVDDVETSDANLSYNVISGPSHGTLTPVAAANGSFTYAPASNYNGGDSFTYSVTDRGDPDSCSAAPCDAPKTSVTRTFSLTVNPVNDQPNATDGSTSMNEDAAPVTVDLTARVDDLETSDANLTYTIVTTTAHGTLTPVSGSNGSFSYDSASNYNGLDSFTYKVTDRGDPDGCSVAPCAAAKTSETKTVSITVNPVNDGPNANDGSQALAEDAAPTAMDLRPLVDDVETTDANLTYTVVTQPAHGTLAATATNGVLSYDSDLNYNGTDSFTYKVTDRGDPDGCSAAPCDAAKISAVKTFSITITPVNDPPAIDIDTVATGQQKTRSDSPQYSDPLAYTVSATDVDNTGAQLTFSASGLPASVTLTDNHNGTATVSGNVGVQAGSYPATIVVKDPSNASDSGTATENVDREDAAIDYTGDTVGLTGSTGLTLRATVWDSAAAGSGFTGDTTIGNITKMYIQFDIYSANSCGIGTPTATKTAQVSDTGTLADGIGTATATYSSTSEASYCIVVKLIGSLTATSVNAWYQADNATGAVITFYNNTGQFVTGGGWILDPAGGGNGKGNFGFNARFNKSGSPQGQMVYVYRGLYNGQLADYRIKSNSLTSLGFSCWNGTAYGPCPLGNATFPAKATLEGKSTIQINRAKDGYVLYSDGNSNFTATVTDSGQSSGIGSDRFELTVYDKNSVLYKSVPERFLGGGNVVVHGTAR